MFRYLFIFFSIGACNVSAYASSAFPRDFSRAITSSPVLHSLPQHFEKNVGQHPSEFHFVAKTAFSQFAFANNRVEIKLKDGDKKAYQQFTLLFEGINAAPIISANKKSDYKVNYYRGNQSQWRKNIDTFSEILYTDIYPNIDLKFYFNDLKLEYDFIVGVGADPSVIQFAYKNVKNVSISSENALKILVNNGIVTQHPPFIYQWKEGEEEKIIIKGRYERNAENSFSFSLAKYDTQKPLIIDPIIEFSSYFGGNWEDNATTVATDSMGNIFLVGATSAQARITLNNLMTLENDALTPMNDVGGLSSYDGIHGISLDSSYVIDNELDLNTEAYACDYRYNGSFSRDSMVTDYDGFITKLDTNYNQIYTTYYGGCRNDGIRDMVIDNDNIYIAGFTLSDNLPSVSGVQAEISPSRFITAPVQADAFYAKFNNDGGLIYSSYFGGDGRDGARAITVDSSGNLFITGYTHSTNLKGTGCSLAEQNVINCENIGGVELITEVVGGQEVSLYSDAFVAKISPQGDGIGFVTYFGGSLDDWGQDIVVRDASTTALNGIYITGNTSSFDLPAPSTGYSLLNYQRNIEKCSRAGAALADGARVKDAHVCEDVYLAKLSLDGTELAFSTYLGGKYDDSVSDMEIDSLGNIYLFGTSKSQGARFELSTLLPPVGSNLTAEQTLQYQEDNAGIISLLNNRFPLYKNIPELGFDYASTSSMAFLSVFNSDATELVLSSFIGGSDEDAGLSIELNEAASPDVDVDVYVGGHTLSNDFYVQSAFQQTVSNSDLFVVKIAMDLTKADEVYDIPVCSNPADLATCINPPNSTCNNLACDLYNIQYSTLIGGEDLDALKDMHYSAFDGGLFLAGTTYSRLFPVISNALKQNIAETQIRDYNPLTRNLELEAAYYPSDMFLMKLTDASVESDWEIAVSLASSRTINKGDKVSYNITISASDINNTVGLTSARINLSFPYLAASEKMANYASLSGVDDCVMEYNQIYCVVGDLAAREIKNITVSLLPRIVGDFPVVFSLMSLTADTDLSNNKRNISIRVKAIPRSSLNFSLLSLLFLIVFSFRYHYLVFPFTVFSQFQKRKKNI